MNFTKAHNTFFQKYFNFEGRASREEFLYPLISYLILSLVTYLLSETLFWIFYIITFLPWFSLTARRLHDTGRSGWWQLLVLTVIGLIPLFYWAFQNGETGENKYGLPIKIT
jgi:uncharacterized membrane protein YhaH (DUF805 family)